jgi:SAM-dependent methyltransferase
MTTIFESYQRASIVHWDTVARQLETWTGWGGGYHRRLIQIYSFLVPPGQRVLEIGCGRGDLLAALQPKEGLGIDFSPQMLERARQRHPDIQFILADVHDLSAQDRPFDYILLSDLVNDVWDVQIVLEQLMRLSHSRTRLIINSYSRLWELPLAVAESLGLAKPTLRQNWLAPQDIINLLGLAQFDVIRHWSEILFPLDIPIISNFLNRGLVKLWPFNQLALTNFIIARPQLSPEHASSQLLVSIIIPARNESGNIPHIFTCLPEMGAGTELVFVEGHSHDDTYSVIERQIAEHQERRCQLHQQMGIGKGDAVRLGLAHATGDIMMIFDADLTVPFEELPRFFNALYKERGEFINGVRLVYPMGDDAMRFLNLWGNKFFSLVFSWLLGQPIKDTLCGTKALWKTDYDLIAANRSYFGDFDPFGDFDLIFGAAKLGLKIVDLPIHYQARTYGSTNIQRWRHGWLLLRMVIFAAGRIKFI